jgi:hypothetical protein
MEYPWFKYVRRYSSDTEYPFDAEYPWFEYVRRLIRSILGLNTEYHWLECVFRHSSNTEYPFDTSRRSIRSCGTEYPVTGWLIRWLDGVGNTKSWRTYGVAVVVDVVVVASSVHCLAVGSSLYRLIRWLF